MLFGRGPHLGTGGAADHCGALVEEPEAMESSEDEISGCSKIHDRASKALEEKDRLQGPIALPTMKGFWEFSAPPLNVMGVSAQYKIPDGLHLKL